MNVNPIKHINVGLRFDSTTIPVGRLAIHDKRIYFEYDSAFMRLGINISPIKCPVAPGVKTFDRDLFEGLAGVFNDSLPDGWGRLLLDRHMRTHGIMPESLTPLDRLASIGCWGMGALVYEPDCSMDDSSDVLDLDVIAAYSEQVLSGESTDILDELILLNGSSAGARPKAMIGVNSNKNTIIHGAQTLSDEFEPWLVKFPNRNDGYDAGAIEYVYALMATEVGVEMESVYLFQTKKMAGYFATKRFDRKQSKRLHVHTACGLLHSDFRTPNLDYEDLMALTLHMTKDIREVERMYRLAVFNVLSYNRDDHAKNFSFLMNEQGQWTMSPAYDLTFSSGPGGEQSTMVLGEGKNPGVDHLMALGLKVGLASSFIKDAIERTQSALRQWNHLAKEYNVSKEMMALIESKISPR